MCRFKQLLVRKGRVCREINHQEQPWGKVLLPHQWIHTISSSYFSDTETSSRWEKLMIKDGRLVTGM